MHNLNLERVPYVRKLGYGIGNLGFGIIFQVVVSYLVFYATVILKIPSSVIGTVVGLGVIWDAVTDPIMGFISDNTSSKKFGRRHLYLLVGGILAALSNYLLWIVGPDLPTFSKVMWILSVLILVKTSLTIFSTPYVALGAELSRDYDERSSIQGIRTIFFLLGIFCTSVIIMSVFFKSTPEYPQGQMNPDAYSQMGVVTSVLMIVSSLITYFSTSRYIPYLPGVSDGQKQTRVVFKLFLELKTAFKNRSFICVVLGYLFTNIMTVMVTSLGLHVFTYTFGFSSSGIAKIFGTLFLTSVLSQPLWVGVSKRIDKKASVILGLIICIFSCIVLFCFIFFREQVSDNILLFIPFSVLMGLGSGVLYSIPLSMVADTIDLQELNTGIRSEGVFYGLLTFCYKASQSIVIFLIGILLEAIGFDANLSTQSDYTACGLGMVLGVVGLIALICGVISYSGYRLNRAEVARIQDRIKPKADSSIAHT
jgi:Na+/melibiose symporter-like transporter